MNAKGTRTRRDVEVAVLGAGIMGCATSLFLAREGFHVTLFDEAPAAMARASRWNEGKIHLGYLYSGDPSLQTARRLLPGGLAFRRLIEELTATSIADAVGRDDDTFLVHHDSVAPPDVVAHYFAALDAMIVSAGMDRHYLTGEDCALSRPLAGAELAAVADPATIVAGFRTPERSVRTNLVADLLANSTAAEPKLSLRLGERVNSLRPGGRRRWRVQTNAGSGEFDIVVNALWNGRLGIDAGAGLQPEGRWSNRYRVSAFITTTHPVDHPSAVVCTGPFGDVKNYDGRHFYLSWYEAGLLLDSNALDPEAPVVTAAHAKAIELATRDGLASTMPGVERIFAAAAEVAVEGGFVFARGGGTLADPASPLHRRDAFGVTRGDGYFSVDTGKYSTAPWLARRLADEIAGR
ncbi:hypothetical protein RHIZO_05241 [Rhizobiaceae bacterium]|nr:hypothetical protein RHIZO_05241 [Rhizobiaceae bacterium]